MTEIRTAILAGIAFGLLLGLFFAVKYDIRHALLAGAISGLVFGAALYLFVTSKTVEKQTQIENLDGQPVVHSGRANHFINGEAAGGKLYLLTDKIQFKSHNFNVQDHSQIIELDQIKEVSFYNTLGLVPNGLAITTLDGQTEKFVVNGRQLWKEEIEKLTTGRKSNK